MRRFSRFNFKTWETLRSSSKDPPLGFKGLCTSDGGLDLYLFTAYQDVLCEEMMAMKVEKCLVFSIKSHITRISVTMQRKLLHEGPDTVEELLDRHVVKKEKILDSDQEELDRRQRLTSTRREALSLYRDIIRATRFFMWANPQGILWRDILRENARREFEEARFERDPEVITRLLIGGRDSVQAALDKLAEKQKQEIAKEEAARDRR